MFLTNKDKTNALTGVMAAYPKKTEQGGHNMLQFVVKERENYIAKVDGPRTFPWRVAIVTRTDAELANTDITYRLAEPSRLDDISWIKPGKVAWEWWNDWNLQGVDFKQESTTKPINITSTLQPIMALNMLFSMKVGLST